MLCNSYRLCEVGKGVFPFSEGSISLAVDPHVPISNEVSPSARSPHCSHCGHPGSKKAHQKTTCEYCIPNGSENCMEKPTGFKCLCSACEKVHLSMDTSKTLFVFGRSRYQYLQLDIKAFYYQNLDFRAVLYYYYYYFFVFKIIIHDCTIVTCPDLF